MIAEFVEQLLRAALLEHAVRNVRPPAPVSPTKRHAWTCLFYSGGMCNCW